MPAGWAVGSTPTITARTRGQLCGPYLPCSQKSRTPAACSESISGSGGTTTLSVVQPRSQPFYVRDLSQERFEPYLNAADGDTDRAWHQYRWNLRLVAAVTPLFCDVEVVLRNTIHRQLCTLFRREDWWAAPKLSLNRQSLGLLEPVIKKHDRKLANGRVGPGRVVADVTLGFWVSLLSKGGEAPLGRRIAYEKELWRPALRLGFATGSTTPTGRARRPPRQNVHDRASNFQQLRNAAAHHRRISGGIRRAGTGENEPRVPLLQVCQESVELVRWMSPELAALHDATIKDVEDLLEQKPE